MEHYYEVSENNQVSAFDTLEDAIEFADKNEITLISEIGGNLVRLRKMLVL